MPGCTLFAFGAKLSMLTNLTPSTRFALGAKLSMFTDLMSRHGGSNVEICFNVFPAALNLFVFEGLENVSLI